MAPLLLACDRGISSSGGNSSGGAPAATAVCDAWASQFSDCAPDNAVCPFEGSLSACELYCLAELNCNFYNPDEADPGVKWGFAPCFASCAAGFYCSEDERIIPARQVCDGLEHCPSGEDEEESSCSSVSTGFLCAGQRIPRRDVCNGEEDCSDGADEAICPGFVCHNGNEVIPASAACDRESFECADESDESDCPER